MDAHPLDFDWRFTSASTNLLIARLDAVAQQCLVIGAPSVWSCWGRGNSATQADLVERNPTQCRNNDGRHAGSKITLDICAAPGLRLSTRYDACFFDPPWYLQDTKYWLDWALRNVSPKATIAFSLWPEDTRPKAREERNEVFRVLERLGRFDLHERALQYQLPEFERRALGIVNPWRTGDLVWLETSDNPELLPGFCPKPVPGESWLRFSVAAKQVAIRAVPRAAPLGIATLSPGYGWFMKSVSRRDPMRDFIDLWTSDGFVARLGNPLRTIDLLRRRECGTDRHTEEVRNTVFDSTGVDLCAGNSDHWMMHQWHYDN